MTESHKRLVALAVSSVLSAAILWLYLAGSPGTPLVAEIDIGQTLQPLLEGRSRGVTSLDGFVDERGDPVIQREQVSEDVARLFFPALRRDATRYVFDEQVYVRSRERLRLHRDFAEHPARGWEIVTNNVGFRGARDLREDRPDLRVLITGDSHIEGVVPLGENVTAVLESELTLRHPELDVEVLNAALGGYSFYNYLGVVEKYLDLEPDLFIMVVYSGNDFYDVLPLTRYFCRMPYQPANVEVRRELRGLSKSLGGATPQWLRQIVHFAHYPEDRGAALHASVACVLESARTCARNRIEFMVALLPPSMSVQPRIMDFDMSEFGPKLGIETDDLAISEHLTDSLLSDLGGRGVRTMDLRENFRSAPELLYWRTDHHLNTNGHRKLAEALVPVVEGL